MADEKKYTAQEAALAVLKKTEEMLKSHSLMKSDEFKAADAAKVKATKESTETGHEKGVHTKPWYAKQGQSQAGIEANRHQNNPGGLSAAKSLGPASAKHEHKKVLGEMKAMPKPNLTKHDCGLCKSQDLAKAEGEGKKDETMAGDKKAPSNSNKPRIEEKPTERDYNDFETKPGHAPENDHRQAKQTPPGNNPHEQAEGNNPEWGTDPGVKGHIKLAHFMGHMSSKKKHAAPAIGSSGGGEANKSAAAATPSLTKNDKMKKGICLS